MKKVLMSMTSMILMIMLLAVPAYAGMPRERTDVPEPDFAATAPPIDQQSVVAAFEPTFAPVEPNGDPAAGLSPQPEYEQPSSARFLAFPSENDYPNGGIPVDQNGAIPRDYAAFGVTVTGLRGGGCFTVSPDAAQCLREVNSNGTEVTVMKKRERWLVRYMRVDPVSGTERLLKDSSVLWATLSNGATCFEPYFYGCSVSGASWDYLDWWTTGHAISCGMPVGAGYQARMYYQYSRYSGFDPIPPGEDVWVPASVPATTTTLDQPGKLMVWSDGSDRWRSELRPGKNAFRVSLDRYRINPWVPLRSISKKDTAITNVGGHTLDQIDPGESRILVDASECGQPYSGVSFTGTIEYIPGSGGHLHLDSQNTTPPTTYIKNQQGTVSDAPATFSGTTGTLGTWVSPPIKAGTFAGAYDIKVHTDNLSPGSSDPVPRDAGPVRLTIGFTNLVNLWTIFPHPAIFSVGAQNTPAINCTSQKCDNHKNLSQFGHPELLTFIDKVAMRYRKDFDPDAMLPVNDMSLPQGGAFEFPGDWQLVSHISHRIGTDFDVNASAELNGVTYTINEAKLDKVVVDKLGGLKIIEPTIHYRLPKTQIDAIVRSIK